MSNSHSTIGPHGATSDKMIRKCHIYSYLQVLIISPKAKIKNTILAEKEG